MFIRPKRFGALKIESAIRNTGEMNMFIINFRNTEIINAYGDGTLAGRIYIEFPTIATSGTAAFADDLGMNIILIFRIIKILLEIIIFKINLLNK